MIGGVRKRTMYSPLMLLRHVPDLRAIRMWYFRLRKDRRDNAVLLAMAEELRSENIELVSSVKYCTEHLADEGPMTPTPPPAGLVGDIEFGWRIARASADLDIGQTVAVKERDIIAVEAMEGTDAMIRRAGRLCRRGGWTMVKVARPKQDMRFDVPDHRPGYAAAPQGRPLRVPGGRGRQDPHRRQARDARPGRTTQDRRDREESVERLTG